MGVNRDFSEGLGEGAYGLSLVVRRPGGPMADLVPIQIGETDQVRRPTTQRDMDASLEACPPPAGAGTDPAAPLVAVLNRDGEPEPVAAQFLGDRALKCVIQVIKRSGRRGLTPSP